VCFVFEFLPGRDLFWVLQNENRLFRAGGRKQWVTFYGTEIVAALDLIHKNQVLYRDLKPDNVMIDADGHIKLIDFGFSKLLNSKQRAFTNCGTVGYTAPEVLGGSGYSYQADVWSFGILLVEMLSG
jgi:serine/threonine protein kinase